MLSLVHPAATLYDAVEDRLWTEGDLALETARRARELSRFGAGPGTSVAIIQDSSADFFLDLFATWSLGAAAACLDPGTPQAELEAMLSLLRPAAVVSAEGHRVAVESPRGAASAQTIPAIDDAALILFTSGTTMSPKGVILSRRALLARVSLNRSEIGDAALQRALLTLPVHFGHGLIGNALTPLAAGGMIVLAKRGPELPSDLGPLIDRHAITFLTATPLLWNLAVKTSRPPAGASLRRAHVGSAPLSGELWGKIVAWTGCQVFNCYGMTETANWFSAASSAEGCADNAVGRPWGGRAGVLGDDGVIHPHGEGEIVVLSPSVMSGYLDQPDLTRGAFVDGWYRTGDIGTVDEGGAIRLTGRLKDEINRGGFKVQPAEIERIVLTHPDIVEACAFGMPDRVSGEVVAIAVKPSGSTPDVGQLRHWCAARMRREAIPERWFVVPQIPRTPRGKLSRDLVRRTVAENG
jgi:oxalate---CoA ligase